MSYAVRYLMSPDLRMVVVLGEAHLKLARASALGKDVVSRFELRGIETFPVRRVAFGRALGLLIHLPRRLLRALSFGLVKDSTIIDARALATGRTFELESVSKIPLGLHVGSLYLAAFFLVFWAHLALTIARPLFPLVAVPLWFLGVAGRLFQLHMLMLLPAVIFRRSPWSWTLHPAIAILTARDVTMAEGTVAMLREEPSPRAAIVIMGRAHVAGYARELVEKHGFRALD